MARLVCDSYPTTVLQPTAFKVYLDGAVTGVSSTPQVNGDSSKQLSYDLTSLSVGSHTVQVTAAIVDVWGTSESAKAPTTPFSFTKRDVSLVPTAPTNTALAA
jgi:hypothetical protein